MSFCDIDIVHCRLNTFFFLLFINQDNINIVCALFISECSSTDKLSIYWRKQLATAIKYIPQDTIHKSHLVRCELEYRINRTRTYYSISRPKTSQLSDVRYIINAKNLFFYP